VTCERPSNDRIGLDDHLPPALSLPANDARYAWCRDEIA
jgi:hypothetical protein